MRTEVVTKLVVGYIWCFGVVTAASADGNFSFDVEPVDQTPLVAATESYCITEGICQTVSEHREVLPLSQISGGGENGGEQPFVWQLREAGLSRDAVTIFYLPPGQVSLSFEIDRQARVPTYAITQVGAGDMAMPAVPIISDSPSLRPVSLPAVLAQLR